MSARSLAVYSGALMSRPCRVDRTKYQIQIPLPPKIDASVTMMTVEEKPDVTYSDIGGSKEQIDKMREVVELPMLHPEKFVALGIDPPKGVLCYGPPGTGTRQWHSQQLVFRAMQATSSADCECTACLSNTTVYHAGVAWLVPPFLLLDCLRWAAPKPFCSCHTVPAPFTSCRLLLHCARQSRQPGWQVVSVHTELRCMGTQPSLSAL